MKALQVFKTKIMPTLPFGDKLTEHRRLCKRCIDCYLGGQISPDKDGGF